MKLYKLPIFASIAMAAMALTGCSDDDNYNVGDASNGAYFPTGLTSKVEASYQESVYEIPVYRVSVDSPTTYNVSVSIDPAETAISIPQTVSFSGSSLETTLPITYDADKLELDKKYTVTLSLSDASDYGDSSYSFTFACVIPKVKESSWRGDIPATANYEAITGRDSHSTATYNLSQFFSGELPDLHVHKEYNPNVGDSKSFDVVVENVFDIYGDSTSGFDMAIEFPDLDDRDENGNIYCRVSDYALDYTYGSYGTVYVADGMTYWHTYRGYSEEDLIEAGYDKASTFNPKTGTFDLYLIYFVEAGIITRGYETIVLDGYPDCTLLVQYNGLFTDVTSNTYLNATFTPGNDVDRTRVAAVTGLDAAPADLSTAVELVNSASNMQLLEGSDESTVNLAIEDSGVYYIIGVTYDSDGVAEDYGYEVATIDLGSGAGWSKYGTATFCDGWYTPIFGVDNTNYMWDVELRKNKNEEGSYRLVSPYNNDGFNYYFYGYNDYASVSRNIDFLIYNSEYVEFQPQYAGVGYSQIADEELAIANYEGYFYSQYADEYTRDDIQRLLTRAGIEHSIYDEEDQVVYVPVPLVYMVYGDEGGWLMLQFKQDDGSYTDIQPSIIYMPDATAATKAKINAQRVAKPKFSKLSSSINAKYLMSATKEKLTKNISVKKNLPVRDVKFTKFVRK
jgi:hypothetical protein